MKTNLFIKLFFFTILIYSNLTLADLKSPKIIGGATSSSNAWPWMVAIYHSQGIRGKKFQCGGSLIDKDWVLTAAHCVKGKSAANLSVVINRSDQTDKKMGENIKIDEIVIHAKYRGEAHDNDYAIPPDNDYAMLKLTSSSSIKPIQLVSPYALPEWTERDAKALGWGNVIPTTKYDSDPDNEDSLYPKKLREVDLTIIRDSLCSKSERMSNLYGKDWITDNMICTGDGLGTKDTCDGDSGGPLIVFDSSTNAWLQAGVTSFGDGCAETGTYGVSARIPEITRWVSELMCSNEEVPDIPSSLEFDIHDDNSVTVTWESVSDATGYHLNYRWPDSPTYNSIDLNSNTFTSGPIDSGAEFYVTITSLKNNCLSKETKEKYVIFP